MRRRSAGLAIAFLLAAIGTLGIVSFLKTAEARATEGQTMIDTIVVNRSIPAGTPVAQLADYVVVKPVPNIARANGAVENLGDTSYEGLVTDIDLVPGEQLLEARFVPAGEQTSAQDQDTTGLMLVTIQVERVRALDGAIQEDDLVAVIGSFEPTEGAVGTESGFVTRNAIVKSVRGGLVESQTTTEGEEDVQPQNALAITLAVPPEEVKQIVFAAEFGSVWLAADPSGVPAANPVGQGRDSVFAPDAGTPAP